MKLRSALLLTLPLVVVAAAFTSRPPPQTPPARHVNVNVTCVNNNAATVVTIAPWRVKGAKSQVLTWAWHGVTAMQVQPTESTKWPLTRVGASSPDSVQFKINGTAAAGTYHYRLTLTCPHKTIVIDPDVIVE